MTMLEKIARSICGVEGNNECEWPEYVSAARAALLAMREPDWSTAAVAGIRGNREHLKPAEIQRQFTAMIDAILKEGGE